jgi:hypothetical protein
MAGAPKEFDFEKAVLAMGTKVCDVWVGPGTMFYVKALDYEVDKHPELKPYEDQRVKAIAPPGPVWDKAGKTVPQSPVSYSQCFENATTLQQSSTFAWNTSTTQTFSWSLTESLKTGLTASVEAGVPAVSKATVSWSVELSVSSTQAQTKTETQSWTINQPVLVPPQAAVRATGRISRNTYDYPFILPVTFKGKVAIMTTKSFNYTLTPDIPGGTTIGINNSSHDLVAFAPIGSLCTWWRNSGGEPFPIKVIDQDTIVYEMNGVFQGAEGIDYQVLLEQLPIGGCGHSDEVIRLGEADLG